MIKFILFPLLVVHNTLSDEVYQNSSHICEKCHCNTEGTEFILDCKKQPFEHVLANWPPHNKTLVAIFSYNNISTLEILPVSNQKARLLYDHCNIKYMDPGVFENVKDVELIDLSYNLLTTQEIDGQTFKGPYNKSVFHPIAVKYLNLAYNQIHSLPHKFFENMPDLEELSLEGNDFTVLDPHTQSALSTLTKLKRLNLANNELTELVGGAVKNLQNLEELDLSSNHLDFVPDTVDYLKKTLKVLKLSDNYIYKIDDKSFLGLDVHTLHLNNLPRLRAIMPNSFTPLRKLRKLLMSNNGNLRTIDFEAFNQNQHLEELYLNNNSLHEIDYKLLLWSNLRIFEIYDNPLECDCNLFNITACLNLEIKRSKDGPTCMDPRSQFTRQMYSLDESICGTGKGPFDKSHAVQHFETMRIIVVAMTTMFTFATMIAMVIAILRYRRSTSARNYPFIAQRYGVVGSFFKWIALFILAFLERQIITEYNDIGFGGSAIY